MQSEDLLSPHTSKRVPNCHPESFIFRDGRLNNSHDDTQYARNPRVTAPGFRTHNPALRGAGATPTKPYPLSAPSPQHRNLLLSFVKIQSPNRNQCLAVCVCVWGGGGGGGHRYRNLQLTAQRGNLPSNESVWVSVFCRCWFYLYLFLYGAGSGWAGGELGGWWEAGDGGRREPFDASERATKTMGTQEALTTVSHAASSGAWLRSGTVAKVWNQTPKPWNWPRLWSLVHVQARSLWSRRRRSVRWTVAGAARVTVICCPFLDLPL